jgi:hypothetical protein
MSRSNIEMIKEVVDGGKSVNIQDMLHPPANAKSKGGVGMGLRMVMVRTQISCSVSSRSVILRRKMTKKRN